ncbi:MAG TPA: NAD-dependent epimerase/dehydratase family protein [Vicinamibacterales bacterium]|nr:NAD-dependent epimerase/dehydratase family protein [Vicinamibacterales bacterium]
MRVFITGATGFVGPAIANAIVGAGHDVRVLERTPGASRNAGVRCREAVQGDVTDSESLRRGVRDIDVVVHLVAIRQGKPEQFERVVVGGTRNLLGAAKEAGVRRFVLMSALGVSEQTKDLIPYYHAKWTNEQDTSGSGVEHVIFRPSFIFGRGGGILPTFRNLAKVAPVTAIIGTGEQKIQPIWVDDVAAYFAQAIDKPEAANRTFDLGGPDVVSWNEFWQRLRAVLGIRRRPTMHVPTALMRIPATVTERLPGNIPLTRDLLKMLEAGDNVVSNDDAARTFGLPLVPLDEQLRRAV